MPSYTWIKNHEEFNKVLQELKLKQDTIKDMMEETSVLRKNVNELQRQLQQAYVRIKELQDEGYGNV
jgi:DNA repair exonuclease SbcCD ATPase subunit